VNKRAAGSSGQRSVSDTPSSSPDGDAPLLLVALAVLGTAVTVAA